MPDVVLQHGKELLLVTERFPGGEWLERIAVQFERKSRFPGRAIVKVLTVSGRREYRRVRVSDLMESDALATAPSVVQRSP